MAKIFGFASGETALKKPMVELLAHVRNLEPPAKSAELVAAERALEAAKKEKVELHAVMMTKADTFRLTEYAGPLQPCAARGDRNLGAASQRSHHGDCACARGGGT